MEVEGKDVWTAYGVKSASSMFVSEKCHVTFKKKEYLAKHMKLKYTEIDLAKEFEKDIPGPSFSQEDDSDSRSDWDEDPRGDSEEQRASS